MTINFTNIQSVVFSAAAALIVSAACVTAAVGPVLSIA